MFISLNDICILDEMYDEYYEECERQGVEPLNTEEWYELIYMNME